MLTGKRFKLRISTMAIESSDGKRVAVIVPAGSVVTVVSGPDGDDRMIDVRWEGRIVVMFAVDLTTRGIDITAFSAQA